MLIHINIICQVRRKLLFKIEVLNCMHSRVYTLEQIPFL